MTIINNKGVKLIINFIKWTNIVQHTEIIQLTSIVRHFKTVNEQLFMNGGKNGGTHFNLFSFFSNKKKNLIVLEPNKLVSKN